MESSLLSRQVAGFFAGKSKEFAAILMRLVDEQTAGNSCIVLSNTEIEVVENNQHVTNYATELPISTPFVLEGNKLYMQRYWLYEQQLATQLTALTIQEPADNSQMVLDDVKQHFDDPHQQQAAELVLSKQLTIITGGPGTGKTTTVVKILALALEQNKELKIALAAPTGKAAVRLKESIHQSKQHLLDFSAKLVELIPEEVTTIHRLLGVIPNSINFKKNSRNKLNVDLLLVDEASMVDLALMSKLVAALKPTSKLIMLGDKEQLSSVESGVVLSDCYNAFPNNRAELQKTYRFTGKIRELAVAVNTQQVAEVISILDECAQSDYTSGVTWFENLEQLTSSIKQGYELYHRAVKNIDSSQPIENTIKMLFEKFNSFQALSVTRGGKYGVEEINNCFSQDKLWYSGRPIMVTENSYSQGLFNGDIGICLEGDEENLATKVYFLTESGVHGFLPITLPKYETAYAITIHKSQGSEFEHTLVVLDNLNAENKRKHPINHRGSGGKECDNFQPVMSLISFPPVEDNLVSAELSPVKGGNSVLTNKQSKLLTKELLYTAITRAKSQVTLFANRAVITETVANATKRMSGLEKKM